MSHPEPTRTRKHGTQVTHSKDDPVKKLEALRAIVAHKQYAKIDGRMVDLYTASIITQVHDALNPENQDKFLALDIARMASVAYKLLGK